MGNWIADDPHPEQSPDIRFGVFYGMKNALIIEGVIALMVLLVWNYGG